jgi:hypothetical protein
MTDPSSCEQKYGNQVVCVYVYVRLVSLFMCGVEGIYFLFHFLAHIVEAHIQEHAKFGWREMYANAGE